MLGQSSSLPIGIEISSVAGHDIFCHPCRTYLGHLNFFWLLKEQVFLRLQPKALMEQTVLPVSRFNCVHRVPGTQTTIAKRDGLGSEYFVAARQVEPDPKPAEVNGSILSLCFFFPVSRLCYKLHEECKQLISMKRLGRCTFQE
ncbi:hypothetical protein AV530_014968 [Patagioenas fasciata monilis]|uniref:Uncharacterized protein n=1 Tax=Patagioenas fasciata monilis TaxID=372326 RepID=A0A1V4K0P9_PATFA|nr:hypothetical protein AV530_014968 [Patagioenas fasciata monilis]